MFELFVISNNIRVFTCYRGVILFAMVNGGLPFKESGAKAVLSAMKKPVYFKGYLSQGKFA